MRYVIFSCLVIWDRTPKHDKFSLRDKARIPSGQDSSILPARVANHSARFGSSCPLTELVIYQVDLKDPYLCICVFFCVQLLLCKKAPPLIKDGFEESRRLHCHSEKEFFNRDRNISASAMSLFAQKCEGKAQGR